MKKLVYTVTAIIFFSTVAVAQKEFVQRIMLDKPVTAGSLKLFPLVEKPDEYYFCPIS